MLNRTHITVLVVLAVLVWGIVLWVLGIPISWRYGSPFAVTVAVLSGTCVVFDRWLWKWGVFRGWLVSRPDINGTWKVRLESDWSDPATGEQGEPVDGIMSVRQTFSLLSARLFTKESSSLLVAHKIVRQDDGVFQMFAMYQNTPGIALRGQKSEIHYGAFLLEVRGDPPQTLVGHYWTDRRTKGSLNLTGRVATVVDGYEEGRRLMP